MGKDIHRSFKVLGGAFAGLTLMVVGAAPANAVTYIVDWGNCEAYASRQPLAAVTSEISGCSSVKVRAYYQSGSGGGYMWTIWKTRASYASYTYTSGYVANSEHFGVEG